ncbi:MAG TPA: YihA family ribosome biogenesis GTP-binding protein [Candidatus Pullichristensenella stercoripullorum]|nr:YihA family ribosome biogenesis GTP-binding protein [Candidatus Pullichristensenella stercoripullorum]
MTIRSAKFAHSLDRLRPFPGQGMPEIAMAGKSNVGKSSMINSLLGNSKLARISSEPGKTRLVNFYRVNDQFWLVDLPGYGFAKAPKAERERWAAMIEGYLEGSGHLKRVLHLVDIRHAPTREDQMMVDYLRHYDIPFTVVATKADKLSRAARGRSIPVICRALAVQPWEVVPYSSEDGTGREKVLDILEKEIADGCENDE